MTYRMPSALLRPSGRMGRGDPASVLADALARSDPGWAALERLTAEAEPKPGCVKGRRIGAFKSYMRLA
jgi:hypothetical protein